MIIKGSRFSFSIISSILLLGTTTFVWSSPLTVTSNTTNASPATYDGVSSISSSSTFTNNSTVTFSAGGTLTIDAGSTFLNQTPGGGEGGEGGGGGPPATIDNEGDITNNGTIESGSYPSCINNKNTGAITNNETMNVALFVNDGSINNSGTFTSTYSFTNNSGSQFTNTGTFTNSGSDPAFENSGTFTVNVNGILDGTSTYTNSLGGILNIGGNATISPNVTIANRGTINIAGSPTIDSSLTVTNNGTIDITGLTGGGLTIGSLHGNGDGTVGTFSAAGKTLTVNGGAYSGSFGDLSSLTKTRSGTLLLLLGNNSAWTGNVTVSAGTLQVGNQFDTTSTLGSGAGTLSVASGATAGGCGTMHFDNATFSPGSTFSVGVVLGSTTSGKIVTNNNLNLTDATINVTHSGTGAPGAYTIAQCGSVTGFNAANVVANGLTEVPYANESNGTITMEVQRAAVNTGEAPASDAIMGTVTEIAQAQTNMISQEVYKEAFRFQRQGFAMSGSVGRGKFNGGRIGAMAGGGGSAPAMDSILQALAKKGPVVADNKNYRLWASPYYMQGVSGRERNKSRDYHEGVIVGFENRPHNKSWTLGVTASGGLGKQILPSNLAQKTKIHSKIASLGFYHTLGFLENGSYSLVVNGILGEHTSERWGNPTPGFFYRANAKYRTKSLTGNFMTAWKFIVRDDFSIRPNLGMSMDINKRPGYTEKSDPRAARYAQTYAPQTTRSRETYGGIGLRKKWKTDQYEFKLTGVYEEGYSLGDDMSLVKVSTPSGPREGTLIVSEGNGRRSQYITAYASLQGLSSDWKFMIGYNGTLQKRRTSHAISLRVECRF